MPKAILPTFPSASKELSRFITVGSTADRVVYHSGLVLLYTHHVDDLSSFRLIACQMYAAGHCTQSEIARFFNITGQSVKRAYKKYCESGPGSFFKDSSNAPKKKGGRPPVFTKDILSKAQSELDKGFSRNDVARSLGINIETFRKAVYDGRLTEKKK